MYWGDMVYNHSDFEKNLVDIWGSDLKYFYSLCRHIRSWLCYVDIVDMHLLDADYRATSSNKMDFDMQILQAIQSCKYQGLCWIESNLYVL